MIKIFISYATEDRTIAESLYGEMARTGVEVFQFGRSGTIGKPAWTEVLDWITESDFFIVLVSERACRSRPVREEIEQAHYSYVNQGKPRKLIPAIIEIGAKPPRLVERFNSVDLVSYEAGVVRLLDQLELKRQRAPAPRASPAMVSLPDLSRLLDEHKKAHPEPSKANVFSAHAEKIVSNYDVFKLSPIPGLDRAKHIDSLLVGLSGAGKPSKRPSMADDPVLTGDTMYGGERPLWKRLLEFDPSGLAEPLKPPTLKTEPFSLFIEWNGILGASAYLLEGSRTALFVSPEEVYRGPDKQYQLRPFDKFAGLSYFRVKALGGGLFPDSRWSNIVDRYKP
jgi:hypothetical protein